MAVTQNTYTGNGSTVLFSFTFPYLETTDIKVSVNGTVTTAYTLANATTIQFNTAPANGAAIRIYRETDDSSLQATFYPGSAIRSSDLNDNFTQNLYVTQEANNVSAAATTTANTALTNSNTAISTANGAVTTANTASSNASAAVATANTASSNASSAVSTANTASSNATTAVNTANSAASNASTALSTANTALSTANTASSNASTALSTANTASTNASAAVSTANTASSNASSAVSTANTASSNASTALSTANTANSKADQAIAVVGNSVLYTLVSNVAAIPASPTNQTAVEVYDSTGIQSFTPLTGLPVGFVGSSGLSVRIVYSSAGSTWNWVQYFPNDPETRYTKLSDSRLTDTRTPTDNTVNTVKIVDGAVTSSKIADGTIVDGDINAAAAIAPSKISGTAVITSDSRLSDTRTPTDDSVTTVKLRDGAVTAAKLAPGAVSSATSIINGGINTLTVTAGSSGITATNGQMLDVAPTSTSGSGTGLRVRLFVSSGAIVGAVVNQSKVDNYGKNYQVGDTVTFAPGTVAGQTSNIVLTVASLLPSFAISNDTDFKAQDLEVNSLSSGGANLFRDTVYGTGFYISDSGNDTTGDGTTGNPWRSLQKAFNSVPKLLYGSVVIYIKGSSYTMNQSASLAFVGTTGGGYWGSGARIIITSESGSPITVNLFSGSNEYGWDFNSVKPVIEIGNMNWVQGSTRNAGGISFSLCETVKVNSNCSFAYNKINSDSFTASISINRCTNANWFAPITVSSSATPGYGALVILNLNTYMVWAASITRSGTQFGQAAVYVGDCGYASLNGCTITNFANGLRTGLSHYNAETGAFVLINGVTFVSCNEGVSVRGGAYIQFYSQTFTSCTTNIAYYNSAGAGNYYGGEDCIGLFGYKTTVNNAYKLQVNSQIYATSSTIATSDARYKHEVQPITDGISVIKQLNPVEFRWKEHPIHAFDTQNKTVGFLAQQVQEALADKPYVSSIVKSNWLTLEDPDVDMVEVTPPSDAILDDEGNVVQPARPGVYETVETKPAVKEEFLGIAEGNLIALLTAALKETISKVETLEAKVAALESA